MFRTPLKQGETINLSNRTYTVNEVIGDGSTCIVYSAYYIDDMRLSHQVNIKECYPYNAEITRNGQTFIWNSAEEKSKKLNEFRTAYEKLMKCQNGNFTAHAFDICECNETLYIILDANDGTTFDKVTTDSVVDILKTVKLLTHAVNNYHKNGYLHLDIKPSNFLVYPRPSEHIVLFDVDTVTSIEDIKTGNIYGVSYSDNWAAPEQKQGKANKLCPATDIYAIGAILFEKIFERNVSAEDSGVFADWEFDNEKFDNINPKIKRLLRNIFKKTLSANIKRRYQSADILLADLDETIKTAENNIYLTPSNIQSTVNFVGRKTELERIHQEFSNGHRLVFLHGVGGIGKTEIAKMYAQTHRNYYDNIIFLKHHENTTLMELMSEIRIENFDGSDKEHQRKLNSLLNENVLVIVDNFDIEIGTDNGLNELLKTKAQILVSTRTDFSEVYSGDAIQIEIGKLPCDELTRLFMSNAHMTALTKEAEIYLPEIFETIDYLTYATELLAKQVYASGITIEKLYNKIKNGLSTLSLAENITTNKDDNLIKGNSLNILRAVFKVADLSEAQKQVLRDMYILNFINVTKNVYRKIALTPRNSYTIEYKFDKHNDFSLTQVQTAEEVCALMPNTTLDAFNSLAELGYLSEQNGVYFLHKVLEEVISIDLKPTLENCLAVRNYATEVIKELSFDGLIFPEYPADAEIAEEEHYGKFLMKLFKNLTISTEIEYLLHLYFIYNWHLNMCEEYPSYLENSDVFSSIKKLNYAIKDSQNLKLQYVAYHTLLEIMYYNFIDYSPLDIINHNLSTEIITEQIEYFEKLFVAALQTAKKTNIKDLEIAIYDCVAPGRYPTDIPQSIINIIQKEAPDLLKNYLKEQDEYIFLENINHKRDNKIPLTPAEEIRLEKWRKEHFPISTTSKDAENEDNNDWYDKLLCDFNKADDKESVARTVYEDNSIPTIKKVDLLNEFLNSILGTVVSFAKSSNVEKTQNFKEQAKNILAMLDNFLYPYSKWEDEDDDNTPDIFIYRDSHLCYTILAIISDDEESYLNCIDTLVNSDISFIEEDYDEDEEYFHNSGTGPEILKLYDVCQKLNRYRYIMPFLIKELEYFWEQQELNGHDLNKFGRNHYIKLEILSEAAIRASNELQNDNPELSNEYLDIHIRTEKLLKAITHKTFDFKPDPKED